MPPRAPVVWTTTAVRSERFRQRLDERHRELSIHAKAKARSYRRSRAIPASDAAVRLRSDFLAALGRLSSFESASARLARCTYDFQLAAHSEDISRDYFELWTLVSRRGADGEDLDQRAAERMDYFAVQIGRLEGMADALILAGRNVRLFPTPPAPWLAVS